MAYPDMNLEMAKAYVKTARQCLERDDFASAEEHLRAALGVKPNDADANLEYGYVLVRSGRAAEAEGYLKKAAALGADARRCDYHLAYAYTTIPGREEEGIRLYKLSMERSPDDLDILAEYAGQLLNLRRLDDAAAAYQDLSARGRETPRVLMNLGYLETLRDDVDNARAAGYFGRAVALLENGEEEAGDYLLAFEGLARTAAAAGAGDAALKAARRLLETHPLQYRDTLEASPSFEDLRRVPGFAEVLKISDGPLNEYFKENATVLPGEKAPGFKLKDVTGKTHKLSDYKGKLVILNIWATWCGPCRREIPDLSAAYDEYRERGVVVLGVSTDDMKADDLKAAAAGLGATYPILLGNDQVERDYIRKSGSIPETYVIGADGRVKDFILGCTNKEALALKITKHLGI